METCEGVILSIMAKQTDEVISKRNASESVPLPCLLLLGATWLGMKKSKKRNDTTRFEPPASVGAISRALLAADQIKLI